MHTNEPFPVPTQLESLHFFPYSSCVPLQITWFTLHFDKDCRNVQCMRNAEMHEQYYHLFVKLATYAIYVLTLYNCNYKYLSRHVIVLYIGWIPVSKYCIPLKFVHLPPLNHLNHLLLVTACLLYKRGEASSRNLSRWKKQ